MPKLGDLKTSRKAVVWHQMKWSSETRGQHRVELHQLVLGMRLLMNAVTEKMVMTALEMDLSISSEQRTLAMRILKHGVGVMPPVRASQSAELSPRLLTKAGAKPYLRRHEAAKYLGCSVRQIDQMKHDGDLPFHQLGRRLIVFKCDDLDKLMKDHRISLDDEPLGQ